MDEPRLSVNVLEVPNPCTVPWGSMGGNERVRFCNQCRKNVYNLSAMTAADAEALLAGPKAPCVHFYRRMDGTVVTSSRCGNGPARVWRRVSGAVGALLFSLGALVSCDDRSSGCTQGVPVRSPGTTTTGTSSTSKIQPAAQATKEP